MQFEFLFDRDRAIKPLASQRGAGYLREVGDRDKEWLRVGVRQLRLQYVRHPRARRYVLRLCADGTARVTIPRRGSQLEGRRFAHKNIGWLEKQLLRQASRSIAPKEWTSGTEILFRGEKTRLEVSEISKGWEVRFGNEMLRVRNRSNAEPCKLDLREPIQGYMRKLATLELPARVAELAQQHQFAVRRVSVRNQRSRWGSCSRRGTISLNWRLIQAPIFVRDYIILHELAHLKEMNHSNRFWREVARLCPDFARAEQWLKQHSDLFK